MPEWHSPQLTIGRSFPFLDVLCKLTHILLCSTRTGLCRPFGTIVFVPNWPLSPAPHVYTPPPSVTTTQ